MIRTVNFRVVRIAQKPSVPPDELALPRRGLLAAINSLGTSGKQKTRNSVHLKRYLTLVRNRPIIPEKS